ncbi:ABC-three component system protein [Azotobacter vinelandii]|uniref:ABC-three component system protein n=1 Tax=Azotobacter vinelandii TaxID=354 RepID=UPI0027D88F0D|nr:ABC-three component system protein [Azotobacter vinelandii]
MVDGVFTSEEEDEVLRNTNPETPDVFAFDCGQLPFERMGDAHFELLLADLYTALAVDGKEDWFDQACRLNDGADQGRDVILLQDSVPVGVIQCKRYNGIVNLPMVIQEICKFFLYATIKPHIAPAPGADFRYYLAVSDRAATKLFEFMQGKGRQRFEDLREEFEDKALAARQASATLKKHADLKDLTKAQLCDIIWARIDNLHTVIHKKDSLSRMVADYPTIKSTYFRLESDTARIVEEIKKVLQSRGAILSDEDAELVSAVRTEYVKLKLGSNRRFNVGLIQGDELLPFVKGMLEPVTGTLITNFGSRPAMLAAGAAAAEVNQWDEINDLVKEYPHPLVFSVGCGEVSGSTLIEWIKSDEMTWLDPKWSPAPANLYRAGWCWVKGPDEGTHDCYILVENETGDQKYDHANLSLRLAFEDVIIWPTLGNDFTNPLTNAKSQLRRIMASQGEDKSSRPNLVLASQNVDILIDVLASASDYYGQRNQSPIGIAIANSGRLRECASGVHSATGVFPALDAEQSTRPTPPAFQPPSRVMRRSSNGALTLTIEWANDLALKAVKGHRLIGSDVKDDLPPSSLEFHELFERHPPIDGYLACVKRELDLLNVLVQNSVLADSVGFTYRTKYGVKQYESFSLEDLSASGEYVMKAVQALSYIKSHKSSQWVVEPGVDGHIKFSDPAVGELNIMAWANHRCHVRQMEGELFGWARKAISHPGLIVFAHAAGHVKDKKPSHNSRYDYTSPPSTRGSITEAEAPRNVYMFNLGEIESLYDDDTALSAEDFMDDLFKRRRRLDAE